MKKTIFIILFSFILCTSFSQKNEKSLIHGANIELGTNFSDFELQAGYNFIAIILSKKDYHMIMAKANVFLATNKNTTFIGPNIGLGYYPHLGIFSFCTNIDFSVPFKQNQYDYLINPSLGFTFLFNAISINIGYQHPLKNQFTSFSGVTCRLKLAIPFQFNNLHTGYW